jgi:hypothetical protein
METPEKEVTTSLSTISNDVMSVEETVGRAEKYLAAMGQIRKLAIKLLNNGDISNQGDKPYLEKSACDKIAAAFGVCVESSTYEKETLKDDRGEYVIYTCNTRGIWNNHTEVETGTCSSRDDFFGKKGGALKPFSEVDLTDIKKKAFTNAANRLIKKLIGLSFSWEEIAELSGGAITKNNVAKVEFGKGSQGGNTDSPETKKLRDECRTFLLKLNDGEEAAAKLMLVQMTAFTGKDGTSVAGKDHISKLSEKQVQILHGKLKKGIADLDAQTGSDGKTA